MKESSTKKGGAAHMQDSRFVKPLKGVPSSLEIREALAAENRPVCVAFSGGKDCIAAEIALQEAGIETVLAHLYLIPGQVPGETLRFVEDGLKYFEDLWQKPIHRYPHPSFYRLLNNLIYQAPENCAVIEAAQLPTPDYAMMWGFIREDLGLDPDTWVADGVRAADSIIRRNSFMKHGAMKGKSRKVSPVWDWRKGYLMEVLESHAIKMPVDYEWFGRSFDGIDARFLGPIRDNAPDDYKQILEWFPLADLGLMRYGL